MRACKVFCAKRETRSARYDLATLDRTDELALIRKIFEFPDIVERAGELYSTSTLAVYLYKLAVAANKFYETTPILKDENSRARLNARLLLIETAAQSSSKRIGATWYRNA